ncbi:Hsp20/alpha crystallin family protein [Candidatus Parcubacteria bacterium]|nr:MAG: Hsp20/alpha crystallin family protein [Candidatus Parcubacteria bacterium]
MASSSEEKFLEGFAKNRDNGGQDYEVKLAAASSPVVNAQKNMTPKTDDADLEPEGQLTIDVYQTPGEIVVESAVAGVSPEDLDINVTTDAITIKGERLREKEVKSEDYFYQECYWGRFSRSVILPQEVDPDKATVNFKNGILSVRLPKLNRQKSKKLKVKPE